MEELKECPFCGGEAGHGTIKYSRNNEVAKQNGQFTFYFVNCIYCGVSNDGAIGHKTIAEAVKAWNTREGE